MTGDRSVHAGQALTMYRGRPHIVFGSRGVHSNSHQGVQALSHYVLKLKQWAWQEWCILQELPIGPGTKSHRSCRWSSGIGGRVSLQDSLKSPFA